MGGLLLTLRFGISQPASGRWKPLRDQLLPNRSEMCPADQLRAQSIHLKSHSL